MKILVSGASFSYGPKSWPELLRADVTNLSRMSAGNTYIVDTTVDELSKNLYNLVIIMWSPFDRVDIRNGDDWIFEAESTATIWEHYESNLMRILGLQEFLKQRKQNYLFTFARPLKVFAKYQELYNQLENVYPECLQTIVKENKWYAEDGVHPNAEAHQYYASKLNEYLERTK